MSRETRVPFNPTIAFHPGVFLAEKLEEMKMSNKEFALRTNKPEKTITAIIKGESSITPDMAVVFETALGIPAYMWLKYQSFYDEFKARERREEMLKESVSWMKKFPVNDMIKRGWLPEARTPVERTKALLKYFGVASASAWEDYYLQQQLKVAFRISLAHANEPEAVSAWLRKGELDAATIQAEEYSASKLKSLLPDIKSIMAGHPEDFFAKLRDLLLEAGVKLVYTPCLPKAPINGATRWLGGETPLIQISGRHKRNDIFWFTIFHEIGHILLHGKKSVFLETDESGLLDKLKEDQADEFAKSWTFSKDEETLFIADAPITTKKIMSWASKFGTHPGQIVGRLQKEGMLPYNRFTSMFKKINIESDNETGRPLQSEFGLDVISYEDLTFELNRKLDCKLEVIDGDCIIECEFLDFSVWGRSIMEAGQAFAFTFFSLFSNYYNEDDDNLTSDAISLKTKLKGLIKLVYENTKVQ